MHIDNACDSLGAIVTGPNIESLTTRSESEIYLDGENVQVTDSLLLESRSSTPHSLTAAGKAFKFQIMMFLVDANIL